jgi:hypothetical protein
MNRLFLPLVFCLILATVLTSAAPTVVLGPGTGAGSFRLPYHQTWNRTLSKDSVYVLTGWYFVDSTYSLTIPAGTVIVGDKPSGGTLIIKRGGRIYAAGTQSQPVVFTSNQPAGSRAPGDWGGVIILGNAPVNQFEPQIEGGFSNIPGASAPYGGSNPSDTSGVLTYLRIEFAGIAFAQDNEINGLTLGAVGSGTTIHHIQVSHAQDDDVEFFGGTVNAKYILTYANVDDNFDTDFGFSGKLQFVAAFRDSLIFDASASGQSNGNESDNNGTAPFLGSPQTHYTVSNMTLVGPFQDTTASISNKWGHLQLFRRNTMPRTYNSIIEGWPLGINIRDSLTQRNAAVDSLQVRFTSIASKSPAVRATGNSPASGNYPGFNSAAWFNTAAWGNKGCDTTGGGARGRQPAAIGLINPYQGFMAQGTWDPRPSPSSEAATAGTSYAGLDTWFDQASYRGAFDPSLPMSQQWTAGWTNLDPQHTNYNTIAGIEDQANVIPQRYTLDQNYPNPFNPSTIIRYALPSQEKVSLAVYNLLGQKAAQLVDGIQPAGVHEVTFAPRQLSSGVYFYALRTSTGTLTRAMVLAR